MSTPAAPSPRGLARRAVGRGAETGSGGRLVPLLLAALTLPACSRDPCRAPPPPPLSAADSVLLDPASDRLRQRPPDTFFVRLATSKGPVTLEIVRAWAPLGAYRFYNLVRNGFYDGSRFYRVLPGFVAQFGTSGRPQVDLAWIDQHLPDDPRKASNLQGTITFAMAKPGTRTTQVFINYRDNPSLDEAGFAPFGRVIAGSGALLQLYSAYGEPEPTGKGPRWDCVIRGGNPYLQKRFGRLDHIDSARIVPQP